MRDNSLTYTLTSPGGTVTLSPDTNTFVQDCEFNVDHAANITPRARRTGAYVGAGSRGSGTWAAQLKIIGSGVPLETARHNLLKVLGRMNGGDDTATLTWTNQGGFTTLQLSELVLAEDYSFKINGGTWDVGLLLSCPRPFAEDATATQSDSTALSTGGGGFTIPLTIPITITSSSGGELTLTNNGETTAYPVLRAYGPLVNPELINQTSGERLSFTGSIAAGDYWEIDLFNTTVKLNGSTRVLAIDTTESTWFGLGTGATLLQLAGSGYSSQTMLRAYMRSAWA